jgi:hypothetical protein
MAQTRLSASVYLVLVFASGILVGAISHRLYVTSTVAANNTPPAPRTMEEVRKRYLADMRAKMGLNDAQISSVNSILDETKRKFDELHQQERPLRDKIQKEQVESIRALMSEGQRTAYEAWRAERARLQEEEKKKKQKK